MGDDKGFEIIWILFFVLFLIIGSLDTVRLNIFEIDQIKSPDVCKDSGIYEIRISNFLFFKNSIKINCKNGSKEMIKYKENNVSN